MTHKYAELVADIRVELNSILAIYPLPTDKTKLKNFREYEYLLTVNKLKILLIRYESIANNDVTFDGLQPVLEFYKERFDRVKKTDACAHVGTYLPAEKLSCQISLAVEKYFQKLLLNKNMQILSLNLRFPLLIINKATRQHLEKLSTHQWFIADDNSIVVVSDCFQIARDTGKYVTTHPKDKTLSAQDIDFLKMHSQTASDCYNSLLNVSDSSKDILVNALYLELKKPDYVVKASYGDMGVELLKTNCFHDFMKDIYELPDWKLLLRLLPSEILKPRVLNRVSTLAELDHGDLGATEAEARLKLIEVTELYYKELDVREKEYKGPTLHGVGMGVSRTDKLAAIDPFLDFLHSGKPLDKFYQYITDNQIQKHTPAYEDKRIAWNSTLSHIITLANTWTPEAAQVCLSKRGLKMA